MDLARTRLRPSDLHSDPPTPACPVAVNPPLSMPYAALSSVLYWRLFSPIAMVLGFFSKKILSSLFNEYPAPDLVLFDRASRA